MEKKRKRASFSPTASLEKKSPNTEEKKEKPVLQQVVEVVIEEPKEKQENEFIEEINPEESVRVKPSVSVIDEEELRKRLKEELREEMRREMEAEQKKQNDQKYEEVNEVEEEPELSENESKSEEEEENDVEVEEASVEADASDNNADREESEDKSEERQKETVAELFGKNSETIMPEITVHKNSNTRGLLIWAITMVAIAVGVGGGLVVFTNRSNQTPSAPVSTPGGTVITPEHSPAVTSAPTPTAKPTSKPVSKKDIKIQIQNGGGVVGAGSKMKTFLEGKGYTVTDVGNASSYDYEETDIIVKESKSNLRDTLEEDISESYSVGKIETTLPESSPYDVRVIVGKK